MWVIRHLIDHLPELEPSDVNGLWNSIISLQFPLEYITEPHPDDGAMELRVFHWTSWPSSAGNIRLPFFTVICYHFEREGDPGVWTRGCIKLNDTLRRVSLVKDQEYYAAVAVGRYVRFFQARQGVLAPFHGETPLHLGDDNAVIQGILDEVRDNHMPS